MLDILGLHIYINAHLVTSEISQTYHFQVSLCFSLSPELHTPFYLWVNGTAIYPVDYAVYRVRFFVL